MIKKLPLAINRSGMEITMADTTYKRRKVHDFIENIFRNIGTIFLGAIIFAIILTVIYLVKDQLHESEITYASVIEVRPKIVEGEKKGDIKKIFEDTMKSDAVRDALMSEIAIDLSYEEFIEYASVSSKSNILIISFEDKEEMYANLVLTKLFNTTAYEVMKEYPIESFEIVTPATYKINATNRNWTNKSVGWFIAVGMLLGGGLTFITLCLFHVLDNTIKDEQDVREYLGIPVLAVVPVDRQGEDKKGGAI